MIPWDVDIGTE